MTRSALLSLSLTRENYGTKFRAVNRNTKRKYSVEKTFSQKVSKQLNVGTRESIKVKTLKRTCLRTMISRSSATEGPLDAPP